VYGVHVPSHVGEKPSQVMSGSSHVEFQHVYWPLQVTSPWHVYCESHV
jgi:hypothetical protein